MRHYQQIKNDFCFLFATAKCLNIELNNLYPDRNINVSPWGLIKDVMKMKGYLQIFKHLNFGARDVNELGKIRVTIGNRAFSYKVNLQKVDFKKTIGKKPMIGIINNSHAIVVLSAIETQTLIIADSQSKQPERMIPRSILGDTWIINYSLIV
jgi:hypothetical protein